MSLFGIGTELYMGETYQDAVGVMITRAPVPAFMDIVRAELHHSVRNTRPYKYMTMIAGADVRVDIPEQSFTL